jgi:hypothetical protein
MDVVQIIAIDGQAPLRWGLNGTAEAATRQSSDALGSHHVHTRKAVPTLKDQLGIRILQEIAEALVRRELDVKKSRGSKSSKDENQEEDSLDDA